MPRPVLKTLEYIDHAPMMYIFIRSCFFMMLLYHIYHTSVVVNISHCIITLTLYHITLGLQDKYTYTLESTKK